MFLVYWGPELLASISVKYNEADPDKRQAIVRAIERLDAGIASDPLIVGESRESVNYRIAVEGPVFVRFRVYQSRRLVRITSISIFRR